MKKFVFLLPAFLLTCTFLAGLPATGESLATAHLITLPPGGAYAMFAGKFGGEISREEIACHDELTVDGCARGSRIFTFTLHVTQNGKTSTFQTDSHELTKAMRASLGKLGPGDTFEFSKMKAYLPNGKDVVDVHGRKFTVV